MAHLPHCREELGLSGRALGSVLLLLALAGPAASQERDEVRGFLGAGVGLSSVHGDLVALVDVDLGLVLSPGVRVGGAAHFLPRPRPIGSLAFQNLELTLGYGGIFVEVHRPAPVGRGDWFARIEVGAGNADVRDASTSLRLDSDNFAVVQPGVGVALPLAGRLSASVGLSYRWIAGDEDLRGVESSDLRSPSLDLRFRIAPL